ncbi:MAG: acyltransferase family protein [Actinomycetes bacterium]|jgi:peptidoglycan/LPS O-acetylase OafA/YrhL
MSTQTEQGTPAWGTRRGPTVPYIPGLDGLRALAVIAVIVYHADSRWLGGGFLGVEVFFVISGYLITLLLVAERERTGSISLGNFWMRRARRLLPALWLLLTLLAVWCAIWERDRLGMLRGDTLGGFFYGANWFQIWTGSSYTSSFAFAPLRHLWSLAVEEQFYIVWPLVMWVLLRRVRPRTSPVLAVWFVVCAAAVAVMTALIHRTGPIGSLSETPEQYMSFLGRQVLRTDFLYLGTFSRASGLFLGAALAMVWRPWALVRRGLRGGNGVFDTLGVAALAALGWMCWTFRDVVRGETQHAYDLLYRGGFLMVGLASVVAIMAVTKPRSILGRYVLGNPVLVWVGTRSYGLYLYHWTIFQLYRKTAGTPLTLREFAGLMAVTVVVTEASYRLVELPVRAGRLGLTWRRWRNPSGPAALEARRRLTTAVLLASVLPLFAFGSMATARVIQDDITANLDDNEEAVVTIPTIAPKPTTAPGQTTVPMPTTSPPKIIDVLAVGDSVMLGSARKLAAQGLTVDAAKNRQPLDALQIFNYYRSTKELGETVVIHLGTNGTTKAGIFDRLMKPLAEVDRVIVLTVRVPTREYEKINNDIIYALQGRYPNVEILDWYTISKDHPEWFAKDKVHPNDAGQDRYVAEIVAKVRG